MNQHFVDQLTHGFLVGMLWAESGDPESPLGESAGLEDLAPQTRTAACEICENFASYCARVHIRLDRVRGMDAQAIGHDLWLTSQGHGAGFWDRGLGALGDKLTAAAKTFSGGDAYRGDDGSIYMMGYENHRPSVRVTVRRHLPSGDYEVFYVNRNPSGYWIESFSIRDGHSQVSRAFMLRCPLVAPVAGKIPEDAESLIGAFENAGPESERVRALPVSRLQYPRGLRYVGRV
jgi:hypothetical protein